MDEIKKLINRKRQYLEKNESNLRPLVINLLKSEIIHLENFLQETAEKETRLKNSLLFLESKIIKLETICFIHGIDDLAILISKSEQELLFKYNFSRSEKMRFYPVSLMPKLNGL